MAGGVRSIVAVVVLLGGCCPFGPGSSVPISGDSGCASVDTGPDAGPPACDEPTTIDVVAVVDLASFRAEASASVCDWSLRCGWGQAGDPFCHPGYAAFVARESAGAAFDLASAQACVSQLASAVSCLDALRLAWDCYELNLGAPKTGVGEPCVHRCVGADCIDFCNLGLSCNAGVCAPPPTLGDPCDPSHSCRSTLTCRGGVCDFAQLDEDCITVACGPGLACFGFCQPAACLDLPSRQFVHHIGCACTSDADCPQVTGACFAGTCTLRPLAGDACGADTPPCARSSCEAGRCVGLASGIGPCTSDLDCATGLTCSGDAATPGLCGPERARGEPCGVTFGGACMRGLVCRSTCVAP